MSDYDKPRINWLSEGIIIPVVPILAYLFAYIFEYRYAKYFEIPTYFISVDINTFFTLAGYLYLALIILFNLMLIVFPHIKNLPPKIAEGIKRLFPTLFFTIITIALFRKQWKEWIGFIIPLAILFFAMYILPLLGKKGKTYVEKVTEAANRVDNEFDFFLDPILGGMRNKINKFGLNIILFIIWGGVLCSILGKAEAVNQKSFLVTQNPKELVALRHYNNKFICLPFDREKHSVKPEYYIFESTIVGKDGLKLEDVGPLHLQKN